MRLPSWTTLAVLLVPLSARAQTVTVDTGTHFQTIDGFGTCLSGSEALQTWWQQLYFDDLEASMVRVDITPSFTSTYSNESYCSPWFGQPSPLELDTASTGHNGPGGTRTRPYTGPQDYSNAFGGCSAPIAVMGPDIDANAQLFDYRPKAVFGKIAQMGQMMAADLGGFKLYASMWSPAPWVKVTSGNSIAAEAWPGPTAQPWPFIWGGNFAGGRLDTSGTPLSVFNDGTADTSALTQFARGLAAFLRGFQNTYGVQFYAISIQNELNFEEFYNSATYPQSAMYIAALRAARSELDQYPDLQNIRILGPEDLIGGDAYGLWQYGSGATATDKNLHYLQDIAADSTASAALAGFAIHGYDASGVSAAGETSQPWDWWANGWQSSPAAGIPANVPGFTSYGKPSWMTESSGEPPEWLASSTGTGGFPDKGAFSIALKIHEALTVGQESAWLYWQMTDGKAADDSDVQTLTDATQLADCPKYVAAKHFFRFIRPGATRVAATVTGDANLLASAYLSVDATTLTAVLINESASATSIALLLPAHPETTALDAYTSSNGSYWQHSSLPVASSSVTAPIPGYGVMTLVSASVMSGPDGGNGVDAGMRDAGPRVDAGTVSDGGAVVGAGSDSGVPDEAPDGGEHVAVKRGCGCAAGSSDLALAALSVVALIRRRRRTIPSRDAPLA